MPHAIMNPLLELREWNYQDNTDYTLCVSHVEITSGDCCYLYFIPLAVL